MLTRYRMREWLAGRVAAPGTTGRAGHSDGSWFGRVTALLKFLFVTQTGPTHHHEFLRFCRCQGSSAAPRARRVGVCSASPCRSSMHPGPTRFHGR
jgi:hypothetical protein